MAERRMFAKTIIGSDAFLDMPQSTQALYFHLSMRADDDGFVNSPKSIMRIVGCKDDDLRILVSKKFIIPFESGVVVIKHWRIHNYISKDRYNETKYKDEKALLSIDENGSYTNCRQPVYTLETQVRLGKDSIGKDSNNTVPAVAETVSKTFKKPTLEEVKAYCKERNNRIDGEAFMAHYESNGWRVGKSPMKNWRMAMVTWEKQSANFQAPAGSKPVEVAIAERASTPSAPSKCTCGEKLAYTNTRAMCKACGNTWDLAGSEWVMS